MLTKRQWHNCKYNEFVNIGFRKTDVNVALLTLVFNFTRLTLDFKKSMLT